MEESKMSMAAAYWNKFEILQYPLQEGANPNVSADVIARLPQRHQKTWRVYHALVEAGSDVNLRLKNEGSALLARVATGDPRSVQILLAAGAFPDAY